MEVSLYTGECLGSSTLKYDSRDFGVHSGTDAGFGIRFTIDMDNIVYETLSKTEFGETRTYRWCPNDEVFKTFGDDSKDVKESYYSIVNSNQSINRYSDRWYRLTTIFSDGTLSLKANKRFAEIEAGEELSGLAYISELRNAVQSPFPVVQPEGMNPLWRDVEIIIPLDNREIVNENVVMHIDIPVKVGMLLRTLQDRITDPEAPMQYRDEVLTCDFTIPKSLQ